MSPSNRIFEYMHPGSLQEHSGNYNYSISNVDIEAINEVFIQNHSAAHFQPDERDFLKLQPESIEINSALFADPSDDSQSRLTWIIRQGDTLLFSCPCHSVQNKLCSHQARALYNVVNRKELRIFFDNNLRSAQLQKFARPYGLDHETDIEQYFILSYRENNIEIKPVSASIFPVSIYDTPAIDAAIPSPPALPTNLSADKELFVVFRQHKYYRHLVVGLFEAASTQNGKPKNPITQVSAAEKIWKVENPDESKFYFGIEQFQKKNNTEASSTITGLKAILKNPLGLKFYYHQPDISENIVANAIIPFPLGRTVNNAELSVNGKTPFYEVSAVIDLNTKPAIDQVTIKYDYFLEIDGLYHLSGNLKLLKLVEFFKKHHNKLLIHQSKYEEFRQSFLSKLENDTEIKYEYLPPATAEQLRENKLDMPPERLIYLKDSDPYVELEPVIKYGDTEISILSKKQIYPQGIKRTFSVSRDSEAEIQFTAIIIQQHHYFKEQAEEALPYFYLHKKHFLNEEWFLQALENWRSQGIKILGFNKLKDNKLNPNPAKISVRVLSGIDWFNAEIDVRFGKKKASLKRIEKAIRNKSKYVALDDGTLGILPEEWIQKFRDYFSTGDLEDDSLKITKSNFGVISQLFEDEMIDGQVKEELRFLNAKLSNFHSIEEVIVPAELNASLRDYQKQGLSWLNFLDDFNFGGCLADDMGLGKTLQIIAFILLLRRKREHNTNLLVVPTSLIFNWQAEIDKFAPDLKIHILYGANRSSEHKTFHNYELIITSYGTLLSDIRFLKNYEFNYVFLDESQNIKNPDSQRHRAACLLKSRNRIVITGTPVENNTFDLFGQLSFACPGLLGSKQYFKEIYLEPIDQFGDNRRAKELKLKVQPFIMRRTKNQVLKELPEKTEMVIYCEMGPQQRKVYDSFEREFREFICSKTNEEIPRSSIHVLKGLTRLRQICNSPLLLHDDEIPERESAKIDTLMEHVLNKTSEHKILIFSQFVSMLDLIQKELSERDIPFSYLSGKTKDRNKVVNEFQEDPSKRIFLISLKAGGTGLNLTQADYVYLVDPWWNPAVENQAIDRIYRIGQKKNVVAVRLICSDTIEEKIMQMQEEKRGLFDNVISTDTAIGKSFTKDGLLKLLNTPLA